MRSAAFHLLLPVLVACSVNETVSEDDPPPAGGDGGAGGGSGGAGQVLPIDGVLGDGTPGSAELVTVYTPTRGRVSTDLDFNPSVPGELWAVLREGTYAGEPCNAPPPGGRSDAACALLEGTVVILTDADLSDRPASRLVHDPNAWHFMRLPSGIAFGITGYLADVDRDTQFFATSGEARTGNYDDDTADFMGPTLWSADPEVFGVQRPGANGSHIDMLHASPYSMGIAHERDNVYWVVNGTVGALDRYDFAEPHEIGGEDHSDGSSTRWIKGELERVPGVPSHVVFDPQSGAVLVADTGHGRVLSVDSGSGVDGEDGDLTDDGQMPFIVTRDGAAFSELVPPGVLERPSGIALAGDVIYVTDNATSRIVAFSLAGEELRALDTGLPEGSLAGITVGPDGKLYLSDVNTGAIRRVIVLGGS